MNSIFNNYESKAHKDIEWLNHTIVTKANELAGKKQKDINKTVDSFVMMIISLLASLGIGYVKIKDPLQQADTMKDVVVVIATFILVYFVGVRVILANLFNCVQKIILRIFGVNPSKALDPNETIIDHFNYVLISKLLLANSFMETSVNENENSAVRQVALSESIYYLKDFLERFRHDFFLSKEKFKRIVECDAEEDFDILKKLPLFRIKEVMELINELLLRASKLIESHEKWKNKEIESCKHKFDTILNNIDTFLGQT